MVVTEVYYRAAISYAIYGPVIGNKQHCSRSLRCNLKRNDEMGPLSNSRRARKYIVRSHNIDTVFTTFLGYYYFIKLTGLNCHTQILQRQDSSRKKLTSPLLTLFRSAAIFDELSGRASELPSRIQSRWLQRSGARNQNYIQICSRPQSEGGRKFFHL
ncbi:Hypothetical_protein [Hexamita inflata]|uniref:Hypothetical_protein n=1 Tax=Hexamita inflata TaxID=28002 RepID=A0AA86PVC9_9EUKA|nr:Hypothetical protein HINF_LOCUS34579 [Hexamita inflata]